MALWRRKPPRGLILHSDQSETLCVSAHETAIAQRYHYDDQSLISHVYDINAIESAEPITEDFLMLAKKVVLNDAQQFKNQHYEYAANPA